MSQAEYGRHRGKTRQYIGQLLKAGVLVMRGGKVDVEASDAVLDDQPVDDPVASPTMQASVNQPPPRPTADGQGASFGQARTIEMVFRAKLRRLEFETKQGKLIDADQYRNAAANAIRTFRDALLGIPDRLATTLAAESDPKKVHLALRTELTRELEAASDAVRSL
jgi:hypothetical protein